MTTSTSSTPTLRRSHASARVVVGSTTVESCNNDFASLGSGPVLENTLHEAITTSTSPINLAVEFAMGLTGQADGNNEDDKAAVAAIRRVGVFFQKFLDAVDRAEEVAIMEVAKIEENKAIANEMADRVASTAEPEAAIGLLKHLLEHGVEDHFALLKDKMFKDRYVGFTITLKDVIVAVKTLPTMPATSTMATKKPHFETILSHASNRYIPTWRSLLSCIRKPHSKFVNVLHVSGVIRPGRLLFLAGESRAGKSNLLRAIAGLARTSSMQHVSGELRFNGHQVWRNESSWTDAIFPITNLVSFLPRVDTYLSLTVRETLTFAWKMRGKDVTFLRAKFAQDPDLVMDHYRARVDLALALVGLLNVHDRLVSTLSGGEVRLLSLAETLVSNSKVMLLDEIGFGLDSVSDFRVVKVLRTMARLTQRTIVVGQVDISSDTLGLFDDIWLLRGGQVIFKSPREDLERQMTVALGRPREANKEDVITFVLEALELVPDKLEEIWETSATLTWEHDVLTSNLIELQTKFSAEQFLLNLGQFRTQWLARTITLATRQFLVLSRTPNLIRARVLEYSSIALLMGLLFFQIGLDNGFLTSQVLSYVVIQSSSLPKTWYYILMQQRPVVLKQLRSDYYAPSNVFCADLLVYVVSNTIESIIYSLLIYGFVGLSWGYGGATYFVFLCLLLVYNASLFCITRMVTSLVEKTEEVDYYNVWLTFMFGAILYMFSGNPITPDSFPVWAGWVFWIVPSSWVLRAYLINEFTSPAYTCTSAGCPNNANGQCMLACNNVTTCVLPEFDCGQVYLSTRQQPHDYIWVSAAFGYLFLVIIVTMCVDLRWTTIRMRNENFKSVAVPPRPVHHHQHGGGDGHHQDGNVGDGITLLPATTEQPHDQQVVAQPTPIHDTQPLLLMQDNKPPSTSETTTTEEKVRPIINCYCFDNVSLTVQIPSLVVNTSNDNHHRPTSVDLVKNVKGWFKSSELTAIMGIAGAAGKSSLIDVLSHRRKATSGDFFFNGRMLHHGDRDESFGFVEQTPLLPTKLTVREAVVFNRELRGGGSNPQQQNFDDLLKDLNLMSHADSLIESLALEDCKRVAVACEIAAESRVILLDEPATGLTQKATLLLLDKLREIMSRGSIIAVSVHRPSRTIFSRFDRVLLLKRGEIAFFGPTSEVISFFCTFPTVEALKADQSVDGQNPATFMLRVLAENEDVAVSYYVSSSLYVENEKQLRELIASNNDNNVPTKQIRTRPPIHVLRIILHRSFLEYWRSPKLFWAELMALVLTSLLVGVLLRDSNGYTSAAQVQNRVLSIATFNSQVTRFFMLLVSRMWVRRRPLFVKEAHVMHLYPTWYHAVVGIITEIPFVVFFYVISATLFFWPSQPDVTNAQHAMISYAWFLWSGTIYALCVTFIGSVAATFLLRTAGFVVLFFMAMASLLSGASLSGQSVPQYLLGLFYIVPTRWFMEAVVTVEFSTNVQVFCNPSGNLTRVDGMPSSVCPAPGDQMPVILDDQSHIAWCCDVPGSLPINVTGYALVGQQYVDGFVPPKWGGAPNGYLYDRRFYDILYLSLLSLFCCILVCVNVEWVK